MSANLSRRVVITGMGLISPLGHTKDRLWEALASGTSGVGPLTCLPNQELSIACAAEARDFDGSIDQFGPLDKVQKRTIRKGLKVMCREIQMGVASAQLALVDAGLDASGYDNDRSGVVYGSDYILTDPEEFSDGVRHCLSDDGEFDFQRWPSEGMPRVTPLWLLKYLPNMPASHIAIYNDLRGPNNSITLREASANLAVAEAYCTIMRDKADMIIAGATGTRLHPLRTVHVAMQEEVAPGNGDPAKASRPFDLDRCGMVLGEGSGAVIVESLESAQAREATIFGEIVGFGSSAVLNRRGEGDLVQALENVARVALKKAGLAPDDVGYVDAHGLSTRKGDASEAAAIHAVFGSRKQPIPVTASKSYFGNLGAGGGLVELIGALMALHHNELFPVLNYETPDPDCPVHPVRDHSTPAGDCVLKLSVTPQGQASSLIIRRFS